MYDKLNEYADQATVNKADTAHGKLLKITANRVRYVPSPQVTDTIRTQMIKEFINIDKK